MGYVKRVARAQARGAKALKVFELLEAEFLGAAKDAHEVWEELQVEIDALQALQSKAEATGRYNQARAQRVRETLL